MQVDHIGQNLKGVEADAHGQGDARRGQGEAGEGVQIFHGEVQVLEQKQVGNKRRHGGDKYRLFPAGAPGGAETLHAQSPQPGQRGCQDHDRQEPRFAPSVKEQRSRQKHPVPPGPAFPDKAEQKYRRK